MPSSPRPMMRFCDAGRRRRLSVETLEDRLAPSAADLTAAEQYFLQLVNQARANPAATAAEYGIDLNEGLPAGTIPAAPVQPLASNADLLASAAGQLGYISTAGALTHTGPGGSAPGDRESQAGYQWTGWGENLAFNTDDGPGREEATVDALFRQLFVDAGVADRGHRKALLDPNFREVGIALAGVTASWGPAEYVVQDFGTRGAGPILTGVAYTDAVTPDHAYTVGEGIGGVTVVATAAGGQTYRTVTGSAGGYALELPAGTYRVAFTTPDGRTGGQTVTIGAANQEVDFVPAAAVPPPPPVAARAVTQAPPATVVAAGAPDGGAGDVQVLDPKTGQVLWTIPGAVPAGIGARVATADVNGDGVADVIVGTGPGVPGVVRVYDGATHAQVAAFSPFEASFTGGVYVAAGDLSGTGRTDLVVTPDEGGGPRVRVFDSANNFAAIADFYGIDDPNFRGGARVAVGDLNGDGAADLVVAAGFGGGPRVAGFDGKSVAAGNPAHLFGDFYAFEQGLRNGTFVAVADVNGDGYGDVVVGGGPGGGPRVTVLSGKALLAGQQAALANFYGGDPAARDGARVAAGDLDGDGKADVVVGSGSQVTAYAGKTLTPSGAAGILFDTDAFPGMLGVYVG